MEFVLETHLLSSSSSSSSLKPNMIETKAEEKVMLSKLEDGESTFSYLRRKLSLNSDTTSPTTCSDGDDASSVVSSKATELSVLLDSPLSKEIKCDDSNTSTLESLDVMDAYELQELRRLQQDRLRRVLKAQKKQAIYEAKKGNKSSSDLLVPRLCESQDRMTVEIKSTTPTKVRPEAPNCITNDRGPVDSTGDEGIEVDEAIQVGFAVLRALKVSSKRAEVWPVTLGAKKEDILSRLHSIISPDDEESSEQNVLGDFPDSLSHQPHQNGSSRKSIKTIHEMDGNASFSNLKPSRSTSFAFSDSAPSKPRRTNSSDDLGSSMNLTLPVAITYKFSPESKHADASNHTSGGMSMPSLVDIESVSTEPNPDNGLSSGLKNPSQAESSTKRQSKRFDEDLSLPKKPSPKTKKPAAKSLSPKPDQQRETKKERKSDETQGRSVNQGSHARPRSQGPRPQFKKATSERNFNFGSSNARLPALHQSFSNLSSLGLISTPDCALQESDSSECSSIVSGMDNEKLVKQSASGKASRVSLDLHLTATVRKGKRPGKSESSVGTSSMKSSPSRTDKTSKMGCVRKSSMASHRSQSRTPSARNRSKTPNGRSPASASQTMADRSNTLHSKAKSDSRRDRSSTPTRSRSNLAGSDGRRRDRSKTPASERPSTRDAPRGGSSTTKSVASSIGRIKSTTSGVQPGTSASKCAISSTKPKKPKSLSNLSMDDLVVDSYIQQTPTRTRMPSKYMQQSKSLRSISTAFESDILAGATHPEIAFSSSSRSLSLDVATRRNQILPESTVSEPLQPPPAPSAFETPPKIQVYSPGKLTPSRKDTKAYFGGVDYRSPGSLLMSSRSKCIQLPWTRPASVDAALASMDWQNQSSTSCNLSVSGQKKRSSMKRSSTTRNTQTPTDNSGIQERRNNAPRQQ